MRNRIFKFLAVIGILLTMTGIAVATNIPLQTGPVDPSGIRGVLNTLINQINGYLSGTSAFTAIELSGNTSGNSTLVAPATGGGTTTLPAGTGTLAYTSGGSFTGATLVGPTTVTGTYITDVIPPTPDGRLSLSSTVSVPTSDQTSAATIYYLPYNGNSLPVFNGTNWQIMNIGASGISFGLGATNMPTSQVYDVYAVNVSGTPTLCSMYWGGNTARSATVGGKSGAANATITQLNGIWVNAAAIATANCYGGASGTTSVTIPINQGTLLGSYYTSGSATTQVVCNPSAASGGTAIGVYLSNVYNQVRLNCSESDTATAVTNATQTYAKLGANDTIQWIDSLGQVSIGIDQHVVGATATAGDLAAAGVACTGTGTTAPTVFSAGGGTTATLADNYTTLSTYQNFYPSLGLSATCFQEIVSQTAAVTATFMPVTKGQDLSIALSY
jgi:hypothetical protein